MIRDMIASIKMWWENLTIERESEEIEEYNREVDQYNNAVEDAEKYRTIASDQAATLEMLKEILLPFSNDPEHDPLITIARNAIHVRIKDGLRILELEDRLHADTIAYIKLQGELEDARALNKVLNERNAELRNAEPVQKPRKRTRKTE